MRPLAILFLAAVAVAQQQQPQVPRIGFLYPAGGRQGASLEVTASGQFLNNANEAYVTGTGVQVSVKQYVRPITPAQATTLRDELDKLNQKRTAANQPATAGATPVAFTPDDMKRVTDIQLKLADVQRRNISPALSETVILQVTIAPDAPLGTREIRVGAQPGLTNPMTFVVGDLPEFSRKPTKVIPAFNIANGGVPPQRPLNRPVDPAMDVTLPAVLNGQIMPATSDVYRFHAAKGQRLVASVQARELIPYISDAVPGWFQAAITMRDAAGKEVASADHFRFHQDPVLYYEVAADGDYSLEIRDSIFRGREDFVYRITFGELPYVTGIFPLGGRAGVRTPIKVTGWNLPDSALVPDPKAKPGEVIPLAVRNSNTVPFAVDALPEVFAQEAAIRREKAQRVKLPIIVNGRIEHPGDWQYFRIDGKAGDQIVAEVIARRLDSPLDSVLRLTDAAGKELAFNDDFDDKGAGLLTHQADSFLTAKLPANGTYYLQLGDTERKGGPEYAYRLRISQPQPDFELRVVPSSLNLRAGVTVPVTVYALRRDGFAGDIAVQLKDAPAGFTLSGAVVPGGQDSVRLTLTAPRNQMSPRTVQLEGHAVIAGKEVHRTAVPADDEMQAFAYHHLVAEKDWMVRVMGAGAGIAVHPVAEKGVKLAAGGTAPLQVFVPARLMDGMVLQLNEPPDGITIEEVQQAPNGMSLLLRADPKVKAGLKGNLIVDAFVDRIVTPQNGPPSKRRNLLGTLPAVPFEVIK